MTQQVLIEHINPAQANLVEMKSANGKDFFLSGIMMMSEVVNGNGRNYPLDEISKAVNECQEKIKKGIYIMGELNHPDSLSINLANVSHAITEIKMSGNNAIGKMKLLNTPAGNIAKGIMEGGVRLGVSSRGSGNVGPMGQVSGFQFVTMDIVSTPSAPDAYPNLVQEALGSRKILTLAEAVVHDKHAQDYFSREIKKLIETIMK